MDYKIKIIELLKKGYTLKEISVFLKSENYETNSLSSIEKHIQQLKKQYGAKTIFQLAYFIFREEQFNNVQKIEDIQDLHSVKMHKLNDKGKRFSLEQVKKKLF